MVNFCSSGQAILKAGEGVNEHFYSGMNLLADGVLSGQSVVDGLISGATCLINNMARLNFSNNYTTLSEDTKYLLRDLAANLAAIDMVTYDLSGYTSRVEAEDVINVLRDAILRGFSILRDKDTQGFILRPSAGAA